MAFWPDDNVTVIFERVQFDDVVNRTNLTLSGLVQPNASAAGIA